MALPVGYALGASANVLISKAGTFIFILSVQGGLPCRLQAGCVSGSWESEIPIGGGESIRRPRKREGLWPSIDLTVEQAVELQLKVWMKKNASKTQVLSLW